MITNTQSGTRIDEIASGIFRINTPIDLPNGAGKFNFNQYVIVDDASFLFHTGPRRLFPLAREAMQSVMPVDRLRYVAFSHFEADECGALNEWLGAAPKAQPVCGQIGAMVSTNDIADRPARALADGEVLSLGKHSIRWLDTPHMPHGWDCGLAMELSTQTFLCGDLFTQGGTGAPAITEGDILETSEAFRMHMDYYAHAPATRPILERLAAQKPMTLACMHGSAWRGDAAQLLLALADRLDAQRFAMSQASASGSRAM